MITDEDIKKLAAVFATKEDLNRFASKEDLLAMETRMDEKYATKDDLLAMETRMDNKYATKDDLLAMETRMDNKYATKDDLKREIKQEINGLEARMDAKFTTKQEIKYYFDELLKEFLDLNLKVDKIVQEVRVNRIMSGEFEARITALEQNPT